MNTLRSLLLLAGFALGISNVSASIVTVPGSLNVGDQFRLVFITLGTIQATSPDINVYNDFVTSQANSSPELASLGTTWKIIGSTATVDAKTNTSTDDSGSGLDGVPIFRLDGAVVAGDYDDLWDGTIQSPIYVAQDGTVLDTCCGSWTGTLTSGLSAGVNALGASASVVDGAPNRTDNFWVQSNPFTATSFQYVYGISDILTVCDSSRSHASCSEGPGPFPASSPGTLVLMTLGILGFVLGRPRGTPL